MARPKRGNYATGEVGLARYKEALRKYLAKTKKTTKPEVKKPVAKKPVAKKPATKKPVTQKPVTKKPVTKKPVTKKPVTKKPVTKKPVTKKPVTKKPVSKVPVKKPLISNNQKLQIKKNVKTVTDTTKKVVKKGVEQSKKVVSNVKKKVDATKKAFNKPSPTKRPTTRLQKLASKGNKFLKSAGKYTRNQVLPKAKKDLLKIGKGILKDPKSVVKGAKGLGISMVAEAGLNQLGDRAFKQLSPKTRGKNMTLKEYRARLDKMKKEDREKYGPLPGYGKLYQDIKKQFTKKNNQSSITKKNITNKDAPNRTSKQSSDLKIAKDRAKKAKGWNKEKLEREVRYQEKFGKQGRTWSNPVGAKGGGKPSTVKTEKKATPTKKYGRAPKGYIRSGTKFVPIRSAQGKQALNRQRNKERAQAAARERLRKKKQNQ